MRWLRRLRRPSLSATGAEEADGGGGTPEHRLPGLAALFGRMRADGSHVILDLGPASEAHLRLFGPYARRVRFAGLLPVPPRGPELREVLAALPPNPEQPYDTVLAWNVLDLLEEQERTALVGRLDEITAPGAVLHALTEGSEEATPRAVRFVLKDLETVSSRDMGPAGPVGRRLLPAHVQRVLSPFDVLRGFTLRHGLREYVAVKPGRSR